MKTQIFKLTYPWSDNGYCPDVEFELGVIDTGFTMHITVPEANPRREITENHQSVCLDSCVEWFVNFMPEKCERYFNFELNALGTINVAFKKGRQDAQALRLSHEDIESLEIRPVIHEKYWEISYTVPFSLIKKYIPDYVFEKGMKIRANFYKIGRQTEYVHFGMWKPIPIEKHDFHTPEYFGEIILN